MLAPSESLIPGPAGLRLAVYDWGGTGSPVLLAHATGFHGRTWLEVADGLVAAGHHVWSFDFHGHGDSSAPAVTPGAYSWPNYADDVYAVTEHLGLVGDPGLVACGHSKGGAALLMTEARHPGTYHAVWTFEPIIFPGEQATEADEEFFLARSARKRRNEWASVEDAYDAYASKPPLNVMTHASLHAYVDHAFRERDDGMFELKCRPEVEAETYAMGVLNGAWPLLPQVGAAARVVCGGDSRSVDPELARAIAARMPRATCEVISGRGHFGPQEDPGRCIASIVDFAAAP